MSSMSTQASGMESGMKENLPNAYLPAAITLDHSARELEQAAGAIPAGNLFDDASGTSYLVTVFAILEVLKGIEGEVCAARLWVKGPLLFFIFRVDFSGFVRILAGGC